MPSASALSSPKPLPDSSPRIIAEFSPRAGPDGPRCDTQENDDPTESKKSRGDMEVASCSQAPSEASVRASSGSAPCAGLKKPLPGGRSVESKSGVSKQKLGKVSTTQPVRLHAADQQLPKGLHGVTVRRSSNALSRQSAAFSKTGNSKAGTDGGWNHDVRVKVAKSDKGKGAAADVSDAVRKSIGAGVEGRKSLSARSSDTGFR